MAVVPGGCTGLIQAPDVSWNKPFKEKMRQLYEEWLHSTEEETAAGNLRPPSLEQQCQWILEAWSTVSSETIQHSFHICALNLPVDGSLDGRIKCIQNNAPCASAREEMLERLTKIRQGHLEPAPLNRNGLEEEEDEVEVNSEDEPLINVESDDESAT